jgi:hypothetical protein
LYSYPVAVLENLILKMGKRIMSYTGMKMPAHSLIAACVILVISTIIVCDVCKSD